MNFSFLKILRSPTPELLKILTNNVIGTPAQSMLYQHLRVPDKINFIPDPYFVCLIKGDNLVATCCFCRRTTINSGRTIRSFYIRYFSFKNIFRRKNYAERALSKASPLREEVKSILKDDGLHVNSNEKFFHYAYVDPRNIRSVTLCREFGFETVRQYSTVIFSRLSPRQSASLHIAEVSGDEENSIKQLLTDFYKDYNMFSFENLFGKRKYYVVKDAEGKVLAGAQVNPDHWKILSLPGLSGRIILNVFPYLPYLRKLINKNYHFLTLEGIYYAPGCEEILGEFFEQLLAKYKLNSAIITVDADSNLYTRMKSLDLGLVDKLNKEVRGDVICRFLNFSEEEKTAFKRKSAYISGIDVT